MTPDDVRRVLDVLAVHPVLPPAEALPPNDEAFQALLADLSRGEGSSHAALLRETAVDRVIATGELARRAEFLLACLVLPAGGTHYQLLGVAPDARADEIRRRWAVLIQRYHPDHLAGGAGSGWLDEQARRLIEAYQTLKDPERRRAYDAELARAGTSASPHPAPPRHPGAPPARLAPPPRWRWAPVGILAVGVAAGIWVYARPAPAPLPAAPLPPAPKLLEQWGQGPAPTAATTRPARAPVASGPAAPAENGQAAAPLATPPALPALGARPAAVSEPAAPLPVPPAAPAAGEVAPPPPAPVPAAVPPRTPAAATPSSPRAAALAPEAKPRAAETPVAVAPPAAPAPAAPLASASAARSAAVAPEPKSGPVERPVAVPPPAAPAPAAPPAAPTAASAAVAPQPKPAPLERPVGKAPPAPPTLAVAPPTPRAQPAAVSVEAPVAAAPTPPPVPAPPVAAPPPAASLVLGPAPGAVAVRTGAPPREDWLGVIEAFREAYQRKDVPGLMAVLAADVRERGAAGRVAIERLYSSNFAVLDGIRYDVDQLELARGGPDELVVSARFRLRATHVGPPARVVDLAGPVRWVLRREAGRLRIAVIEYEVSK